MITIKIYEHCRVDCRIAGISEQALIQLYQFETRYIAAGKSSQLFEIDRFNKTLKVKNYVGVIQVPGLTLEILPKIDKDKSDADLSKQDDDNSVKRKPRAQKNLLYMLSFTKKLPFEPRDLASLETQNLPLMETLIRLFANRLMNEMRRGVDRSYVHREDNLPCIKGKISMNHHIRLNAAHRERFYVEFDEFIDDTPLNRILKATCRRLISVSSNSETQRILMETTAVLDDVSDIFPDKHHFDRVHLHRNNERFQALLDFCRIVWQEQSPNPSYGKDCKTFSLLFPMEKLFEEFISRFIHRNAEQFSLGLKKENIYIQSVGCRENLVKDSFQLKPDLIIKEKLKNTEINKLILDTKWKCLKSDDEDRKNGVAQADMYQMYAYAKRYNCAVVVLLYPDTEVVEPKFYSLLGAEDKGKQIRVQVINLNEELSTTIGRNSLIAQIKRIIRAS